MASTGHLVFASVGEENAISSWYRSVRPFDIAVAYYGDCSFYEFLNVNYYCYCKGFKIGNFLECSRRFPAMLDYDYYLFIDDDIVITPEAIGTIFELARRYDLDACQPALAEGSVGKWRHTKQDQSKAVEFTNLVEIQCFCISRRLLTAALPFFPLVVTGWGLDLILWDLLGRPRNKMAILHAVGMLHPQRQGKRVSELVPDFDKVARRVEEDLSHALGCGRAPLFDEFRVESFGCVSAAEAGSDEPR